MPIAFVALLLASVFSAPFTIRASSVFRGSGQMLAFSDKAWELRGDRTAIVKDGDRNVLQVETGFAHRRDVRFENGTLDLDVQVTKRRSFVYIHFRAVTEDEREEFYLRPHKSELPDAVQYAPVWQGRSAWQLYHGVGGTAAIGFEPGVWTHVRVVVKARQAALFIKDMNTPALLVPQLAREPAGGGIALGAFLPAGTPGEGPVARFADVVLKPDVVTFDFASAVAAGSAEAVTGNTAASNAIGAERSSALIRAWSVSQAFVLNDSNLMSLPSGPGVGAFRRLETDQNGLLPLHRHVRMPEKSNTAAAVARVRVRAERTGTYGLDFGFSDIATVFVNGRPIFRGDASYSFDRPRREGLIGFDQARVYLPLVAGDNELAVVVSDSFGGWGLMGRFVNADALSVEAR
jgi:hypothetical protein